MSRVLMKLKGKSAEASSWRKILQIQMELILLLLFCFDCTISFQRQTVVEFPAAAVFTIYCTKVLVAFDKVQKIITLK